MFRDARIVDGHLVARDHDLDADRQRLIAGAVVLIAMDKTVPSEIWTLGGTVVGALASILVATHSTVGPNEQAPTAAGGTNG